MPKHPPSNTATSVRLALASTILLDPLFSLDFDTLEKYSDLRKMTSARLTEEWGASPDGQYVHRLPERRNAGKHPFRVPTHAARTPTFESLEQVLPTPSSSSSDRPDGAVRRFFCDATSSLSDHRAESPWFRRHFTTNDQPFVNKRHFVSGGKLPNIPGRPRTVDFRMKFRTAPKFAAETKSPSPEGLGLLEIPTIADQAPITFTRWARREILREAVLRWTTPLVAARCSSG